MRQLALALLAATAFTGPAQAITVYSNNFDTENGGASSVNYNGFTGLSVTGGTVDLVATPDFGITCAGGSGSCVDLDGSTSAGGTLTSSATYSFLAGDTVTLKFMLGGNQRRDDGGDGWGAGFTFSGNTALSNYGFNYFGTPFNLGPTTSSGFDVSTGSGYTDPFSARSVFFTAAQSGSFTFDFSSLSSDNVGALLDDVSLDISPSAVPEPAQWAMLLGGFAFAGAALRRRRPGAVLA